MPNPLFNALGGGKKSGNRGSFQSMMSQFNQFKNAFQGNPKEKVEALLQSGEMSQDQFNQLYQAAEMFQSLLGG